ncbi:GGDEF domain-containing protein [Ketobacter sp.]|uniref:GGDEF domain-containing protein n=1 Tax=Ketobacter sp. TaxID=2083498 RepID=UPI000F1B5E04|nr:GGDEF domain-containing protein [Ketobacter sp.]RLU00226.1 MAG: GGDEF domain-containing protein [Ketobacter sp.]
MALTSNTVQTGEMVSDAQFRLFRIFDEVDLKRIRPLLNQCRKELLTTGEVLLRPEYRNDNMYLLLSGRVAVTLESLDATPLVELGSGECIGEMSVFDGRNPSAYVQATEPCEVVVIEKDTLWQLIDSSHSLCRNLLYFLSNRLRTGNDIVAVSKSREKEQEQAANVDALTGVHNRRWLQGMLDNLKGHELAERMPLAVLMLDVDHFKKFNDTYGHKSGDLVLQMVARIMRKSLRPSDMLARYGGEEFMVLLPCTPIAQAKAVAERLRKAVANCRVSAEQGVELPAVTISVGVSPLTENQSLEQVIEAADEALYLAKHNGRNRIEVRT